MPESAKDLEIFQRSILHVLHHEHTRLDRLLDIISSKFRGDVLSCAEPWTLLGSNSVWLVLMEPLKHIYIWCTRQIDMNVQVVVLRLGYNSLGSSVKL